MQEGNQPRRVSQTGKGKTALWIALAAAVLLAGVLAFFLLRGGSGGGKTPVETNTVNTPVGELTFPERYAGEVRAAETSADPYTAAFYASVGKSEVLLFSVSVGGGSGYLLGSVPDTSGTPREIRIDIDPIEPDASWAEEDVNRINGMQECVNDLMDEFRQMDGFQKGE